MENLLYERNKYRSALEDIILNNHNVQEIALKALDIPIGIRYIYHYHAIDYKNPSIHIDGIIELDYLIDDMAKYNNFKADLAKRVDITKISIQSLNVLEKKYI
jgi:hypothetical protein